MIPKILHYVWVGPRPLPDADIARIEHWRRLQPDWEFRFWTNDNLPLQSRFLRQAFSVRAWNRVANLARMWALAEYGGVYLDTDIELIKPLDPLLRQSAFIGFQNQSGPIEHLINGAVIGTVPGHWLPSEAVRRLDQTFDGRHDVGASTGPGLVSAMLHDRGLEGYSDAPLDIDTVTVYPTRFFYPYPYRGRFTPDVVTPDTFAIHHWADSWRFRSSVQARLRRKALLTFANIAPDLAFRTAAHAAGGPTPRPAPLGDGGR